MPVAPPRQSARILVVDDSAVMRRILTMALAAEPRFEVVTAVHGQHAVEILDRVRPDAITLDVEMPELDGIGVLRELRRRQRRLPVIMFSTLTERGAVTTVEALALGAADYVTKPTGVGAFEVAMERVRAQLLPKLRALLRMDTPEGAAALASPEGMGTAEASAQPRAFAPVRPPLLRRGTPELLVIGVSTGGPGTLETLLSALPASFPVPIAIVQHMPEHFTNQLAQRLDRHCALRVQEAVEGAELARGTVWIARGGRHCEVRRTSGTLRLHLHDEAPVQYCRPSVDVLFHSAALSAPGRTLGLVLTGMGRDGAAGAAFLRQAGCHVLAQDEATSVVYGMPRAVAERGLATEIVALPHLAERLQHYLHAAGHPLPVAAL